MNKLTKLTFAAIIGGALVLATTGCSTCCGSSKCSDSASAEACKDTKECKTETKECKTKCDSEKK